MHHWHAILMHVPTAMLVMFRIGGLFIFAPVLSSKVIPGRVKVLMSMLLAMAIYPIVSTLPGIDPGSLKMDVFSLAPLMATELLIGAVIGFVALMPLMAMQIGGLLMGQQMGLGFASFYDPSVSDEMDLVGRFFFLFGLAGFVLAGALDAIILALLNTFAHVPLGGFMLEAGGVVMVTGLLTSACEIAMRIAAPVLAVIFLQTVAMGFVSKTVPQLNILSLGFPIRILLGLAVMVVGVVAIDDVLLEGIDEMIAIVFQWIEHGQEAA